MTKPIENIDLFGQEIKEGDYILRSHALGRSSTVSVSKVLKADDKGLRVANVRHHWNGDLERIQDGTIKHPQRCVKVSRETIPAEYLELFEQEPEPEYKGRITE